MDSGTGHLILLVVYTAPPQGKLSGLLRPQLDLNWVNEPLGAHIGNAGRWFPIF